MATEYFVLEPDMELMIHAMLSTNGDTTLDLRFLKGTIVVPNEVPGRFRINVITPPEEGGRYPDFLDAGHGPAVSEGFRQTILSLGADNVQFFPAQLVEDAGPRPDLYFLMNVIGRIAALDENRVRANRFRDAIVRMKYLAINPAKAHDQNFFRLHEYPDVIIISQRIAERLRATDFTGYIISPAEGWNDKHRF